MSNTLILLAGLLVSCGPTTLRPIDVDAFFYDRSSCIDTFIVAAVASGGDERMMRWANDRSEACLAEMRRRHCANAVHDDARELLCERAPRRGP